MTPRRAFWEAVATVLIPSFVIWGAVLCVIYAQHPEPSDVDSFLLFFVLFALLLPAPVIVLIYWRYRAGKRQSKPCSPQQHFVLSILFALVGTIFIIDTISRHPHKWELVSDVAMTVLWFSMAAKDLRSGLKSRAEQHVGSH
jgi:uncharacterized membrane protein YhaH (DUF805 family)